jgi:capsular polysaccharide biosynthesis protein
VELKTYLNILWRRRIWVLLPPLLALLAGVWQLSGQAAAYTTELRASVLREAEPPPENEFGYNGYYNNLSTEFAIDDLIEAMSGNVFAEAVAERAQQAGADVTVEDVESEMSAERRHRIVTVTVTSSDRAQADAIAAAAAAELEERAFSYISVSGSDQPAEARIIQRPEPAMEDTGRQMILVLLQLVAAGAFGVLLAFLIDYLDDTLYDGETAALALRVPHLASVPAETGSRR